jgi:hypothetical protein
MTGTSQALQATEADMTGQQVPHQNAMQVATTVGLITHQTVQHTHC